MMNFECILNRKVRKSEGFLRRGFKNFECILTLLCQVNLLTRFGVFPIQCHHATGVVGEESPRESFLDLRTGKSIFSFPNPKVHTVRHPFPKGPRDSFGGSSQGVHSQRDALRYGPSGWGGTPWEIPLESHVLYLHKPKFSG